MTVPSRRAVPALLQIDAVLVRLPTPQIWGEVARYLQAEFLDYRWVGVYRRVDDLLRLEGSAGDGADELPETGIGIGIRGRAVIEDRMLRSTAEESGNGHPEIAVPISSATGVVGVLAVVGKAPTSLDGTDGTFLGSVARKLAPALAQGPTMRLL